MVSRVDCCRQEVRGTAPLSCETPRKPIPVQLDLVQSHEVRGRTTSADELEQTSASRNETVDQSVTSIWLKSFRDLLFTTLKT